jgi:Tfp pilus assembly protein PilF
LTSAGKSALAAGRFTEAAAFFAADVAGAPHDANALHGLALAFEGQGHLPAALGAVRRAVLACPEFLAAQMTLGTLCERIGYTRRAIEAFESARRLAPLDPTVLRHLAGAYRRGRRVEEALAVAAVAIRCDPQSAESFLCLGDALLANEATLAADDMYRRALALDPQLALAECGRGAVHLAEARWRDAHASFDRALALVPGCAEARYNRALLDLRFGAYRRGFADYPAIMDTLEQRPRYHYYYAGVPLWDGARLGKRRLVIAFEQGLGNQILIARFFDELSRCGEAIVIESPPTILALLRRNFPDLTFVSFTRWQPLEVMDLHLPLMQLPTVLNVADETRLANHVPYLVADPVRVAELSDRLHLEANVRHVGIVWHGNRESSRDRWRAAPLSAWAPLARVPGIRFHSLQLDATAADLSEAPFALAPTHEHIRDMDDTAALVALMDLIVTVDTSIVHLAGALGRPTWMPVSVLSDYRWEIDRTDSPWYPTLRIFRQSVRDAWEAVFAEIAEALRSRTLAEKTL